MNLNGQLMILWLTLATSHHYQQASGNNNNKNEQQLFYTAVAALPRKPDGNLVFIENNDCDKILQNLSKIQILYTLKKLTTTSLPQLDTSVGRNCIVFAKNPALITSRLFAFDTCSITLINGVYWDQIRMNKNLLENQTNLIGIKFGKKENYFLIKNFHKNYILNVETNLMEFKRIFAEIVTNFNRRILKVTMFQKRFYSIQQGDKFVGFDGDMLDLLEERLNFTRIMVKNEERYGYQFENGTFGGLLGDIIHKRADLALNSIFIKYYESDQLQFTTPILLEELCILVPSSEVIPQWMVVFLTFESEVWLAILFCYTSVGLLWHLLEKKFNFTGTKGITGSETSLNITKIFLQQSVNINYNRLWQRLYLIILILGSMVLSKSLEGSLLDKLTKNTYRKEMSTLEELSESSLKLYTLSVNLYKDTFPAGSKLQQKFSVYEGDPNLDMVRWVNDRRDVACIGRKFDLIRRLAEIKAGKRNLHIIEECPRSYNLAYIIRKDSYLYNPVQKVLSRLLAAGIIDRLQYKDRKVSLVKNAMKQNKFNINRNSKRRNTKQKYKPLRLNLQNLMVGIIALIFGYTISIFAFVLEIVVNRRRR